MWRRGRFSFEDRLARFARCRDGFQFAGSSTGAPISFTKNTTKFAGSVALAFREMTWTSLGPSWNVWQVFGDEVRYGSARSGLCLRLYLRRLGAGHERDHHDAAEHQKCQRHNQF